MEILRIRREDPQAAYNRACKRLSVVAEMALGAGATRGNIREYNSLHGQVRRRHPDGTIGHLHLKQEILLFDARIVIPAPDKKIPFRLKT